MKNTRYSQLEEIDRSWDDEDNYSPQMSHRQQLISDRYDMVSAKLQRGEIDEGQAAEMRKGA